MPAELCVISENGGSHTARRLCLGAAMPRGPDSISSCGRHLSYERRFRQIQVRGRSVAPRRLGRGRPAGDRLASWTAAPQSQAGRPRPHIHNGDRTRSPFVWSFGLERPVPRRNRDKDARWGMRGPMRTGRSWRGPSFWRSDSRSAQTASTNRWLDPRAFGGRFSWTAS